METIEEIIENWKAANVLIDENSGYVYEKDCTIGGDLNAPAGCEIIMTMCDNYTHKDGVFFGSSHVGLFYARHQGENADQNAKNIERMRFRLELEQFTDAYVDFRRSKLQNLRNDGHQIEFRLPI